ncbi:MAG: hypothetical protein ACRC0A_02735 [Chitinophagaceae bacterium]
MKLTLFFILNMLLSLAMELFFSWWIIAIVSVILSFLLFSQYIPMLILSFLSIFINWGGIALYLSINNQHLLLQKMVSLWGIEEFIFIPFLITGGIGGSVSVVGSSLGYWLRYLYISYRGTTQSV